MTLRKITVGRAPSSDIYLDDRYVYASKHHGIIFYDGNQLMYTDRSSNGTIINNHRVKHRTVLIQRGDIILVAGRYPLDWNQIDTYLPSKVFGTTLASSEAWRQINGMQLPMNTNDWNWGAMGLYPLWGLQNGCSWAVLVAVVAGVLLFPLPNLFFGFYGTKLAWHGRTWASRQVFHQMQQHWARAGIVAMCCETVAYFLVVCLLLIHYF